MRTCLSDAHMSARCAHVYAMRTRLRHRRMSQGKRFLDVRVAWACALPGVRGRAAHGGAVAGGWKRAGPVPADGALEAVRELAHRRRGVLESTPSTPEYSTACTPLTLAWDSALTPGVAHFGVQHGELCGASRRRAHRRSLGAALRSRGACAAYPSALTCADRTRGRVLRVLLGP
jgi:hypothetical protein